MKYNKKQKYFFIESNDIKEVRYLETIIETEKRYSIFLSDLPVEEEVTRHKFKTTEGSLSKEIFLSEHEVFDTLSEARLSQRIFKLEKKLSEIIDNFESIDID